MSETRITNNRTDVIYEMPPFIADELAAVLNHWAIHKVDGSLRKPARYDQGWILDAEELRSRADVLTPQGDLSERGLNTSALDALDRIGDEAGYDLDTPQGDTDG